MTEKAEIVLSARDDSKAAFQAVQRNLDGLKTATTGLVARFAVITAAASSLSVVFDHFDPRPVINAADSLDKLAQRTGIATDTLSAYQYAAKLADVSNEELADSLKKLNVNIAAAARGETAQAEAFKAIGVSVVDAAGKVRSAGDVFRDIADRFSTYEDGANKVAIANAVGGKSFERLIPILNGGSKGLQDARAELEKFGGVIGPDFARKAVQFNDNLLKLGVAGERAKIALASGIINSLVEISDRLVEAAKNGDLLKQSFVELAQLNPSQVLANKVGDLLRAPVDADGAQENLKRLNAQLAATQAQLAVDPGNSALADELVSITRQAEAAAAALARVKPKSGNPLDAFNQVVTTAAPLKKQAPKLASSSAASDADALLRKQLDGNIQKIQANLERELDQFKFTNQLLEDVYRHGETSIDAFYDEKNRIQLEALAVQKKAFDDEIAAREAAQKKLKTPQGREEEENRINEAKARSAKADREGAQATQILSRERQRAAEDFQRTLLDIDAQFAELAGDKVGAALLRNAQQLDAARKALGAGSPDQQIRLADLDALLKAQTAFNAAQEQSQRINERAQVAEEAFLIQVERGDLSREETERGLMRIRGQALAQTDELIAAVAKQTETSKDPSLLAFYDQLRLARERAFDQKDPGLIRFNQLATDAGQAIASSFGDALVNGAKLRDLISSIDKQLVNLVTQDLVVKPFADAITGLIKGLGAGGQGGGFERLLSGIFGGGAANASAAGGATDVLTKLINAPAVAASQAAAAFSLNALTLSANTAAAALASISASSVGSSAAGFASLLPFGLAKGSGPTGGVDFSGIGFPLAEGTDRVPYDGFLATLHKDERVVPAKFNPAVGAANDTRPGARVEQRSLTLHINVQADAATSRKTAYQQGLEIGRGVQAVMARGG